MRFVNMTAERGKEFLNFSDSWSKLRRAILQQDGRRGLFYGLDISDVEEHSAIVAQARIDMVRFVRYGRPLVLSEQAYNSYEHLWDYCKHTTLQTSRTTTITLMQLMDSKPFMRILEELYLTNIGDKK